MRLAAIGGLILLGGCGGGSTTGTNYADPPPMAEIVATPSPKTSPSVAPPGAETPDNSVAEAAAE